MADIVCRMSVCKHIYRRFRRRAETWNGWHSAPTYDARWRRPAPLWRQQSPTQQQEEKGPMMQG